MANNLIPRVRVNYSLWSCLRSLLVSESSNQYRETAQNLLSKYYEGRPVQMTAAGRCALYYIFKSLPQKKVMIPAYTCSVVAEAAVYAKKDIIYVESDGDSFNANNYDGMDSDTIVVATHQFGYPCDIESIAEQCKENGAILVEDCAAAIGTMINGKKAGTFGDFAILSFNHSKQLILPRGGGCIIAKNDELMKKVQANMSLVYDKTRTTKNKKFALICLLLNNKFIYKIFHQRYVAPYDDEEKILHATISDEMDKLYSYQMDNWQAYLLIPQIKNIEKLKEKRNRIFEYYQKNINNSKVKKPKSNNGADYSRYAIQIIDGDKFDFYQKCLCKGIDLDFSHSHLTCPDSFAKEYQLAKSILDLPFYYKLTQSEAKKVVEVINSL